MPFHFTYLEVDKQNSSQNQQFLPAKEQFLEAPSYRNPTQKITSLHKLLLICTWVDRIARQSPARSVTALSVSSTYAFRSNVNGPYRLQHIQAAISANHFRISGTFGINLFIGSSALMISSSVAPKYFPSQVPIRSVSLNQQEADGNNTSLLVYFF